MDLENIYLEAALKYEALGISVVPIAPGHKGTPKGVKWKIRQTKRATPDEIRQMWRDHPKSHVGMITGAASGVDSVDLDGSRAREILEAVIGIQLPDSISYRTGRDGGGQQVFFKYHGGGLKTKAGYVSPTLKDVFERRLHGLGPDDWVFSSRGRQYNRGLVRQKLEDVCMVAEIPYGDKLLDKKGNRIGIVFHCLRYTRTSRWVEMGFSDEIIRRATGHKSLEAYQKYVKLDPKSVMRLVSKTHTNDIKTAETGIISGP